MRQFIFGCALVQYQTDTDTHIGLPIFFFRFVAAKKTTYVKNEENFFTGSSGEKVDACTPTEYTHTILDVIANGPKENSLDALTVCFSFCLTYVEPFHSHQHH